MIALPLRYGTAANVVQHLTGADAGPVLSDLLIGTGFEVTDHDGDRWTFTPSTGGVVLTVTGPDRCTHPASERFDRTAHGYLGDAPAGTIQEMCAGCGAVIAEVTP